LLWISTPRVAFFELERFGAQSALGDGDLLLGYRRRSERICLGDRSGLARNRATASRARVVHLPLRSK